MTDTLTGNFDKPKLPATPAELSKALLNLLHALSCIGVTEYLYEQRLSDIEGSEERWNLYTSAYHTAKKTLGID